MVCSFSLENYENKLNRSKFSGNERDRDSFIGFHYRQLGNFDFFLHYRLARLQIHERRTDGLYHSTIGASATKSLK